MEKAKKSTKREFSAGGVVFHRSGGAFKVLLIKDSYGRWALPKGHIGDTIAGETSQQAALRECSEETGIPASDLRVIEKLGETKYFFQLKGERIFKIVTFFLIESTTTALKPEWEVQAVEWFSADEAVEKNEYDNSTEIIRKAIEKIRALK